jgi:protein SCO1
MINSPIILSERYVLPKRMRADLTNGANIYGHEQPSPDELGGVLDFTDWRDNPVGAAQFVGRWTLLYFGYSRCSGSCKVAVPLIVSAAKKLRASGLSVRAAFVDIDAAPLGLTRLKTGSSDEMQHGPNWDKRYAMRSYVQQYGNDLMMLTGARHQIAEAGIAYHVTREHIPPRHGETGHSINHSSMIYFISPDLSVAGYAYHDADTTSLTDTIIALDKAPRKSITIAAQNRQSAARGCGPTGVKLVTAA